MADPTHEQAIERLLYRPLPNGKVMCELCAQIAAECEAQAVDAERERCAALADACHMERVLQHPEALKAGGDAAAVAAKGSEAARIAAAIRRSTRQAEPVSDDYKLADAVRPWRELVERAVPIALVSDAPTDEWMRDAKALLEKPCSTS